MEPVNESAFNHLRRLNFTNFNKSRHHFPDPNGIHLGNYESKVSPSDMEATPLYSQALLVLDFAQRLVHALCDLLRSRGQLAVPGDVCVHASEDEGCQLLHGFAGCFGRWVSLCTFFCVASRKRCKRKCCSTSLLRYVGE
ncbi:hypothetical protein HPB48_012314 [Haemaphysalis longicornis]|uniref:Uncharacterized protein n=1 Tax=Haemaphysalis longicornis TaxID=44386 RepID=A0A9J6GYA3_HAELO|nr:hypothetical protein HPB48_012314 [Haemaphysalis longicornis]